MFFPPVRTSRPDAETERERTPPTQHHPLPLPGFLVRMYVYCECECVSVCSTSVDADCPPSKSAPPLTTATSLTAFFCSSHTRNLICFVSFFCVFRPLPQTHSLSRYRGSFLTSPFFSLTSVSLVICGESGMWR